MISIIIVLSHFALAEPAVKIEAQPIIAVGSGDKPIDTEAPSPIAPQSFDDYDGVALEPFAPTVVEKQAMLKERAEAEAREIASKAVVPNRAPASTTSTVLPKKKKSTTVHK